MKVIKRHATALTLSVALILLALLAALPRSAPSPEHIHMPLRTGEESGLVARGAEVWIDVNRADQELLQTLPGIGEALARSIVEEREKSGRFRVPEDLKKVSGIGDLKLNAIRKRIIIVPDESGRTEPYEEREHADQQRRRGRRDESAGTADANRASEEPQQSQRDQNHP